MKAREEIASGFFVACRDASELFDILKETFDQITLPIEGEIAGAFDFAIGLGRDRGLDAAGLERGDEAVGVVTFVGE